MGYKKTLTPGAIEVEQGTLSATREDVRLNQLVPSEILENKDKLDKFLKAYYTFMNMDEFIFQETNTFTDVVLNGQAQFRIPDPNNENNKFFTDESGADSTLVLTSPTGTTNNITLNAINVAITNGNELPGTLATSTSEIGKTFTVTGLESFNNHTAKLTTIQKNWVGPGPSYVMNTIEEAMDIDTNDEGYLELMQKEIAATIPRGVTVNKRTLYKQIIDFYRLRGTTDSIEIFFQILFNDFAEIEFPFDKVLIPSSGNWDVNPSLSRGGQYLDNKGFLSDSIKIQDSKKFQKFSYLIKTGKNLSDWDLSYNKLVHPAGFIYFAEILIFLQLTKAVLGEDEIKQDVIRNDGLPLGVRKVLSAIPTRQPGIVGPEDIPLLIEMFVSTFLPNPITKIHKSGTVSLTLKNGVINAITITNGGTGYTAVPTITTSDAAVASGFTTASLTPVITNGSVASVTITDGGRDYGIPQIAFSAPTAQTFNGSSASIVSTSNNTITLSATQRASWQVDDQLVYSTTGTAIGGLQAGGTYYIKTITGNAISLYQNTTTKAEINISGLGVGSTHTLTGITATGTATSLNGQLKALTVEEPGFGYTGSSVSISFNGVAIDGLTGVAPVVSIALDSEGKLNGEAITITSRGSNWSNLFGSVPANPNASKIASISLVGLSNKLYSTAPTIIFPEPTAVDAEGNLLSTNVKAVANFTLDSEGEITGVNISNAGNGYVFDPIISFGSGPNNETRVKDVAEVLEINCNHNEVTPIDSVVVNPRQASGSQDGRTLFNGGLLKIGALSSGANWTITQSSSSADKFLPEHRVKVKNDNFRTIINNNYIQRKGTDNFFTSPRLYNTNRTIESLGNKTLQTIDSSDINNNNTSTFVHIE
tara:strand:- start:10905 stop:13532 length:2628 start_codon:yes stop_codon:yes gene_type:complete